MMIEKKRHTLRRSQSHIRVRRSQRKSFKQRLTITVEDNLLEEIDAAAKARGYQNRSEIIRDVTRAGLQQSA